MGQQYECIYTVYGGINAGTCMYAEAEQKCQYNAS